MSTYRNNHTIEISDPKLIQNIRMRRIRPNYMCQLVVKRLHDFLTVINP
ncbi:Uncharacterised protein [Mycobacteroides abscessus subsp. abscessus]|nr:Uncharacterised protein [Mycobacteroides abscessus subsp. abscessus]